MSVIESAFVLTLVLLLAPQEPFADSSTAKERVAEATAEATAHTSAEGVERSEGFDWSASETPRSNRAWTPSTGHREADGYSWSTARAGQGAPVDRTR